MKFQLKTSCLGMAIAAIPLIAPTLHAQDAARADSRLEEIIVTAQRRAESFQDVPITVNTLSEANLEQANVTRLEDIARLAPAVQIARTGIYTQPSIRGVTTVQGSVAENNVAIYVDSFYQAAPMSLNLDLLNVSGVQVLKGPQGTLFGRNATGGAILLDTLDPSLEEREGRVRLGYGRFNDYRAQLYYSTPLTDTLAVNIAASRRESDGYIKDISGFDSAPLESDIVHAKLLFEPTDNFRMIAGFNYSELNDGRALAITYEGRSLAQYLFPDSPVSTARNRTSLNHPVEVRSEQKSGTLTAFYDFPTATLSSYTYYQDFEAFTHYEIDGSPQIIYDQWLNEYYRTVSQEFNLTSTDDGPLQYVLGLFYYQSDADQAGNYALSYPSTVHLPQAYAHNDTESVAGYADVTWEFAENWYLTGGIRHTHETKEITRFAGSGEIQQVVDETFKNTIPRVVLRYAFDPNSSVYASYSEGFKSGGINTVAPYATIDPEEIKAYEIGFKTQQPGYILSAAAFYYDYADLQVSSVVVVDGIQNNTTANAANAEIYGAEVSLAWDVTEALQLNANLAYTHARYEDFTDAPVSLPNVIGLNSASCANNNPPPATVLCTQDWSGRQMVRAPEWSGNLSGSYTIGFGDHTLLLSGNVYITDRFLPNKADIGVDGTGYRYYQGGYTLISARADWTLPGDRLTLGLYGNNLLDKSYAVSRTGSAFGDYRIEGEPRVYGVMADYRF